MPNCIDCGKIITIGPRCLSCGHKGLLSPMKGKHHTVQARQKMSAIRKGRKISEIQKEKLRIAHKGQIPWSKGLTRDIDPRISSHSAWNKGLTKETDERVAKYSIKDSEAHRNKRLSEFHKQNISMTGKGLRRSLKTRQKISEANYRRWNDPEYRNRVVKSIFKTARIKPNNAELSLNNILETNFSNEWKFVGDGQLIIAGKCPDFVNTNGKKALIELFGDYWHRGENPEDRAKVFEPYGYDTLVIWEKELKDSDLVTRKIRVRFYE